MLRAILSPCIFLICHIQTRGAEIMYVEVVTPVLMDPYTHLSLHVGNGYVHKISTQLFLANWL